MHATRRLVVRRQGGEMLPPLWCRGTNVNGTTMKSIRLVITTAVFGLIAVAAGAQPGPPASGPRGGPGAMGGQWGHGFTPGWSMMTAQERQEHQDKMRSIVGYEECKTYMDQHHQLMVERAKAQGRAMPARRLHDACRGFKR